MLVTTAAPCTTKTGHNNISPKTQLDLDQRGKECIPNPRPHSWYEPPDQQVDAQLPRGSGARHTRRYQALRTAFRVRQDLYPHCAHICVFYSSGIAFIPCYQDWGTRDNGTISYRRSKPLSQSHLTHSPLNHILTPQQRPRQNAIRTAIHKCTTTRPHPPTSPPLVHQRHRPSLAPIRRGMGQRPPIVDQNGTYSELGALDRVWALAERCTGTSAT